MKKQPSLDNITTSLSSLWLRCTKAAAAFFKNTPKRKKNFSYYLSFPLTRISLCVVLLLSTIMLANILLKGIWLDATEGDIYSLSDGSKSLLKDIEHPVRFTFFFSNELANGIPAIKRYARRVEALLGAYAAENDSITLSLIDPEPFSAEEDRAIAAGMHGVPADVSGNKLYFGLHITNALGQSRVIGFFHPDRESFIEYEISRMIHEMHDLTPKRLGLLTSFSIGQNGLNPHARDDYLTALTQPPLAITEQLKKAFKLVSISEFSDHIPDDIDVLMILQPASSWSNELLASIDHYVTSGGKTMIIADPYPESYTGQKNTSIPNLSSAFADMMRAWGVTISRNYVVGDRMAGRYIQTSASDADAPPIRYPLWLELNETHLNRDEVMMHALSRIHTTTPGALSFSNDSDATFTPLIFTSKESSGPIATSLLENQPDPLRVLRNFAIDAKSHTIAARIDGPLLSAFPKNTIAKKPSYLAHSYGKTPAAEISAPHPTPSPSDTKTDPSAHDSHLIIIADTDLLRDDQWMTRHRFAGQSLQQVTADNGAFILNAIDYLSGNEGLLSLRGRKEAERPFTVVQDLKKEAEDRFIEKETLLNEELTQAEERVKALKEQANSDGSLLAQTQIQEEIARFSKEMLRIRSELRKVRHRLNDSIQSLGSAIAFIIIWAVPLLILLTIIAIFFYRRYKKT